MRYRKGLRCQHGCFMVEAAKIEISDEMVDRVSGAIAALPLIDSLPFGPSEATLREAARLVLLAAFRLDGLNQ